MCKRLLKGTVSQDFFLLVFFMNQFPPSPRVSHLDRFEFFRKFAEIFADQGWPPVSLTPVANEKNLQKIFNNFVGTPLNSINNTSKTGGKICRRCRWYRWQICHRCRWYRWSTLSCECLREFSKKFETALVVYSGAWGKLIHEKNQKQKISWHCPFNYFYRKVGLIDSKNR